MSETRMEYLQGERESKIREYLRDLKRWELFDIIIENEKGKNAEEKEKHAEDFKEMLIEFIIEKNYMELE